MLGLTDQKKFIEDRHILYARVIDLEDGEEIVKAIIPKDKLHFEINELGHSVFSSIDPGDGSIRVEVVVKSDPSTGFDGEPHIGFTMERLNER